MIDNDFPFSVRVIRTECVQSFLLSLWKHSSKQQAFFQFEHDQVFRNQVHEDCSKPNVIIYKCSCFPLFILILGEKLQILFKSRGRNTITPAVQYDCSWLCTAGGSTDEAQYSFVLLIIIADTNGGGVTADSSLAFAFLSSVLCQMHTVPVRQNRGYVCMTSCFYCEIFDSMCWWKSTGHTEHAHLFQTNDYWTHK